MVPWLSGNCRVFKCSHACHQLMAVSVLSMPDEAAVVVVYFTPHLSPHSLD